MRLLAVPLLLLLGSAPPALAQDMVTLGPKQIGEIFCIARIGNDMAPVTGLLTPDLAALIAQAELLSREAEAANPGEKPPLGDGLPWATYPDHAPSCKTGEPLIQGASAEQPIAYGFPQALDAAFTDTLLLKLVNDAAAPGAPRWRLDNVAYAESGSLRSALEAALAGGS